VVTVQSNKAQRRVKVVQQVELGLAAKIAAKAGIVVVVTKLI
jgi:hypothetical protein